MTDRPTRRAWYVFGIATLFYLYELVLRVSPSVMTSELLSTFGGTSTMLGILVSFYYYSYTAMQLPCGIILDRLGTRNLLALSCLFCSIGSVLFAVTNNLHISQIGRLLVGMGSACAFISCLQIASNMFPKHYFVLLAGITNMMGTLGGLFGGMPVAKAVQVYGWQNTTYALASGGAILCILTMLIFPKEEKTTKTNKISTLFKDVLKLIRNNQIVLSGVIASFMYLPVCAFAELWAVPYFKTKFQLDDTLASLSSAFTFLGVAIGSILMAVCANKLHGYIKTLKIAMVLNILLFFILFFGGLNFHLSLFVVFVIGLLTGAQPICFTCAKNNADPSLSGTTLAITNCIVMLIGSIFQPLLGMLLDVFWNSKTTLDGVRIYDVTCYNKAMMIIPLGLLVSYFVSLFVKENIDTK